MASILQLASSPQVQPRLRGITGPRPTSPAGPQRLTPRLKIVNSPAKRRTTTAPAGEEKEDYGILGGALRSLGSAGKYIAGAATGLPTFVGKTAQTAAGFGEGIYDFAADLASTIAGADKEFYTSRFETDLEKARELGLSGPELIAYASQRQYPLGSMFVQSGADTGRRLAEVGTLGRYDYGEEGIDYANALRQGNLGALVLEDLGNAMLVGRALGAGNVAAKSGTRIAAAGAPRLGTAVRRAGYLSEQPIAATAQMTGRLLGRGLQNQRLNRGVGRAGSLVTRIGESLAEQPGVRRLPRIGESVIGTGRSLQDQTQTGLLARVGAAATAAGAPLAPGQAPRPIRTFGETFVEVRRAQAEAMLTPLYNKRTDLEIALAEQYKAKGTTDRALVNQLADVEKQIEQLKRQTAQKKLSDREIRKSTLETENVKRFWVQRFTDYAQKGPSSGGMNQVLRAASRAAMKARPDIAPQIEKDLASKLAKLKEAKQADRSEKRMSNPQYIDDSFGASVIIATGQADVVIRELNAGNLTLDQLIEASLPAETSQYLRDKGYTITPEAMQRALDYEQGRADIVDQVSIESALALIEGFSEFMTTAVEAGEGIVKGAASPFQRFNYPLPEFVFKELSSRTQKVQNFVNYYLGSTVQRLLPEVAEVIGDEGIKELGIDGLETGKIYDKLANSRKDSEAYALSYEATKRAFEELMTDPDPTKMPEGFEFTPELRDTVRQFLTDPMIFPAKARIAGRYERTLQAAASSRDVQSMATGLRQLLDDFPDVLPKNLSDRIKKNLASLIEPGKIYDPETFSRLRNNIQQAIEKFENDRATTQEQIGVLGARRQELLGRQQVVENLLRETQIFVENVVRNPEQFFPTETAEVARLRGVASEAQAGLEALGEPGRAERPFRPQTELEDNTRQLEQQKSEIATEVQQVERDISVAERRLAEAESLTPEDIELLKTERGLAEVVETENPYEQITTTQAKAELKKRLDDVRERIREEDKALRDATVTFMRTGLTEDLKASIDEGLGAGRSKALYEAFVRRFTKPKPPPGFNVTQLQGRPNPYSDLPWDSAGDAMARNFNLAEADGLSGITEAARRFKRLQDIKAELSDLRKVEKSPDFLEDFRKEIEDELNSRVDDYRESQYREVDLTSPEGFTRTADDYNRILNDAQNPDLLRLNLETLRGRARSLQDQIRQIDQTIADNASDVQRRIFENESLRLRGVERRATQEAEGLVSANLQAQTRGVRGMLRGVGAVRQDQPVLQRQFAGPLEVDQARMVAEQTANEAKTAALREEFAVEDAALAEAQAIPGQATALSEQLAQPVGPLLVGDRNISYIPAGIAGDVEPSFSVPKMIRTEGAAPESIGGIEKTRTGSLVPYTPGQMAKRIDEVMRLFTRNIVIQRFIRNRDFVTTVADLFAPEELQALRDKATAMNSDGFAAGSETLKRRADKDYQILLAQEIRRRGLEPVSPVAMPDPDDIYAGRAALGALDQKVDPADINENTLLMNESVRQGLASEFEAAQAGRGPDWLRTASDFVMRNTGSWKSMVLPFSLRWQVGDAMGNVMNAWVRGDIPPAELTKYINMAYEMMRESQTMLGGQLATRRQLMFTNTLQQAVDNPFLALAESFGLQSSGIKASDTYAMMNLSQRIINPLDAGFEGRKFRRIRTGAFAFNEFQNRLARVAVAMKYLDEYLQNFNLTFDEVTPDRVMNDKFLENALADAVKKANDVLGNFSELSPFERQTMRTIFPFWSWMKFINKAAMQLLIDQPDRLLFMAHLGSMTMEEEANGLWEFLRGKPTVAGQFTDFGFINPYSDAVPFMFNKEGGPLAGLIEEAQSISPVLTGALYGAGETFYGLTGRKLPLLPTFSRPGYLEGRPGETTRTLGDTLGGMAYFGLKQFGGPVRNILELSPVDFTIPGTDVAVGYPGMPRFPQGSLRTTGQYGVRRLSPNVGRLSAVMRTLGMPAPIVSADVAQRASFEAQRTGRDALQRRLKQRRLAQR